MVQWRDISGWPGYMVSDEGQVVGSRGKILNPSIGKKGYRRVTLSNNGTRFSISVHVLVLETFLESRPEGCEVRHLDGNTANNRLRNLKWGSAKENAQDKFTHGTHMHGVKVPWSKLSNDDVQYIRSNTEISGAQLARRFGVNESTISRIRSR